MKLKRAISPLALLFAAVGGIVGSGWLFGPMIAAQIAGPAAVLSWAIGGLLMMFIALTFAELATTFPVAGGMVRFAEFSHGHAVSFAIGWMVWLSSVVVAPVETLALLQYAANYIPGIVHTVANHKQLTMLGVEVAAVLMLIMCSLNWMGAKFFSKSSSIIVSIKLIVPIITLIVLLFIDFHFSNFYSHGGFVPYGWKAVFAALPLGGVIFSFIGYSPAIQLAEEARNPQRAIPYAIVGSVLLCILLYTLLQVSFIGSMSQQFIVKGWHALSFKGDSGPFAGILAALGVSWLVIIIYADAVISPFGTAYIYTASTARVTYALSQVGFMPKLLQRLNRHHVPMRAIGLNFIVGMMLFLPFPGWQDMVSFLISCFVVAYSIGPIALLVLRRAYPNQKRPFHLPIANVMTAIAFYICNLLIYWTGWHTVSKMLIAMAIGGLVYFGRGLRGQFKWRSQLQQGWWLIPFLLGHGLISYYGAFGGGKNWLGFGEDFVIIAVFSAVIFVLALKTAKPYISAEDLAINTD